MDAIIEGRAVHTGGRARAWLEPRGAGVFLRGGDGEWPLAELAYDGELRSTRARTRDGRARARTLEHLFAALAGEGVYDGVTIVLEGEELPIADGGARAWVEAVRSLALPRGEPSLFVARDGELAVGASRYAFRRGSGRVVDVEVEFADPRIAPRARWEGDREDFRERIAPARTFVFEHELGELAAKSLASFVPPESVVVLAPEAVYCAGAPFTADEPARHKLLDLIGDLYAHGGPPRGEVRAFRPGHRATHEVVLQALEVGLLARVTSL